MHVHAPRLLGRFTLALLLVATSSAATGAREVYAVRAGSGPVDRTDASGTVWLCRPGLATNPCTANLTTTVVNADGSSEMKVARPASNPPVDCFYVYPTVSTETGLNADLKVQEAETSVAIAQASRFSQVCRVWAPMYRQRTLISLALPAALVAVPDIVAYQSTLAGWQDYLKHYNDGRPVVFIGHSQGASMLIELLRTQVDPNLVLRRRLVSAIILGGNVTAPASAPSITSLPNIPPCASARQTGCAIAYSSYPGQPPTDSYFGRPRQGLDVQASVSTTDDLHVLCVNPAAPAGGTAKLDSFYPTADLPPAGPKVATPWVEYSGEYTAVCKSAGNATWLQVTPAAAGDRRPRVPQEGGARWGFHVADVNLALGNLVQDVRLQIASYLASTPAHT